MLHAARVCLQPWGRVARCLSPAACLGRSEAERAQRALPPFAWRAALTQRDPAPAAPSCRRLDKRMRKDQRGQQRAEKRMKGKKGAGGVKGGKAGKNRRR